MTANPLAPIPAPLPMGPMNPSATRLTPVDPLKLLRQHVRLLIATAIIGVVVGVITWGVWYLLFPRYTSQSQLVATSPLASPYDLTAEVGSMAVSTDAMNAYIQNQIIRLRSDDVITDALRNPELRQTKWFESFGKDDGDRTRRAKEHLQEKGYLRATHIRGSTTIIVAFSGSETTELAKILDIILNVYLSKLRNESDNTATGLRQIFVQERKRAEDDIVEIQNRIKLFMQENDLPNLQPQLNEAQIAYQLIADQEAKLRVAMQAAKDAYAAMTAANQARRFSHAAEEIAQIERDPAVATRDERIRQLREERETQLYRLGENHFYIRDLDNKIAATQVERKREFDRLLLEREQVMLAEVRKQAEGMEAQLIGLRPRLDEARERMRDLSQKLQAYDNLAQQLKLASERRDKANLMLDDERVRRSRPDAVRIRLQMGATIPKLSSPRYEIVIPGVTLLCIAAVAGGVYLRESLDQRVKSPTDIKLFTDLELLGVLPDATEDPSSPARIESVVQDDPAGLMAESFRQIRTAVVAQMDKRGHKSLLVVSPSAGSGSSSFASNLSMSLGYVGRKVLLLDANLRRPHQHYIFGIPQQPGLVELLRGTTTMEQAIFHKVEPSVDILPAGDVRDIPPEMLEGAAFRAVLGQLEKSYDLIVIDCSPALLTSDCQMLAKHADAMIVVVRAMADKRGMIGRMIRQVEGSRAVVLGLVLNRAQASAGGYFKQTYEEFYNYRNQPAASDKGATPTPMVSGKA